MKEVVQIGETQVTGESEAGENPADPVIMICALKLHQNINE